jgi:hypothetical protein
MLCEQYLGQLDTEDEDATNLQNVRNYSLSGPVLELSVLKLICLLLMMCLMYMTFRVKVLTWYCICQKYVQVVVCCWLLMLMLSFMGMMLICDREMMVPENGGMSVKLLSLKKKRERERERDLQQ